MSRGLKRALWIVISLVALGAAAFGVRVVFFGKKPPPSFDTAKVVRGHIVAKVTATGTLSALVTVQVGAQVSGRISALHADWNSEVKKGELIGELDPELFQAAVNQARANWVQAKGTLAKSKANAENMKLQLERAGPLLKEGLLAQQDYDTARANDNAAKGDVLAQEGNLAQAAAQLEQAAINLKYTRILSPVDGTVISRSIDVGQTVAASLQAPVLFTIAEDLRKMQVDTNVSEGDVGKLEAGMEATFVVDAFPNDRFKGTVRQIRNAATNVQNVITYDAVLDVVNTDLRLRPGMTANVTFIYAEKTDVIEVPNAALRFRPSPEVLAAISSAPHQHGHGPRGAASSDVDTPPGEAKPPPDHRAVWVLREGTIKRVRVKTGVTDGTSSEILEGDIEAGDEVVVDVLSGPKPPAGASSSQRMPRIL